MMFSKYNWGEKLKKSKGLYFVCFVGFAILGALYVRGVYLVSRNLWGFEFSELVKMAYVLIATMFLYGTFQRVSEKFGRLVKIAEVISATSFSIYLYHILVLYVLRTDLLKRLDLSVWGRFAVTAVVMYGGIFIYSYGMRYLKMRFGNIIFKQNGGRSI